jgi:hypothetical protein
VDAPDSNHVQHMLVLSHLVALELGYREVALINCDKADDFPVLLNVYCGLLNLALQNEHLFRLAFFGLEE